MPDPKSQCTQLIWLYHQSWDVLAAATPALAVLGAKIPARIDSYIAWGANCARISSIATEGWELSMMERSPSSVLFPHRHHRCNRRDVIIITIITNPVLLVTILIILFILIILIILIILFILILITIAIVTIVLHHHHHHHHHKNSHRHHNSHNNYHPPHRHFH